MRWYRAVKKLHLERPTEKLLLPFCGSSESLSAEEAGKILSSLLPMHESSCVPDDRRRWEAPVYDLSILIPVYNNGSYIEQCVRSALEQKTDFKTEIIVVNDGSTDETAEKLKAFEHTENVMVFSQVNQGVSSARNKAVDEAKGRYLLFLDGDDLLLPGAVQALMQAAVQQNAAIVEGGYQIISREGKQLQKFSHKTGQLDLEKDLYGFPCFKVFERSIWENLSFPPGYHYEDSIMAQILWEKAALEQKKAWGIEQAVGAYRVNPRGATLSTRVSASCIDTVWITALLMSEREKLGLPFSQYYYEHLLDMAALSWSRTELMPDEVRKAVFFMYRHFIFDDHGSFHTVRPGMQKTEQTLRDGRFEQFELICSLR